MTFVQFLDAHPVMSTVWLAIGCLFLLVISVKVEPKK